MSKAIAKQGCKSHFREMICGSVTQYPLKVLKSASKQVLSDMQVYYSALQVTSTDHARQSRQLLTSLYS